MPLAYSSAVTDGAFACVADRMADALAENAPVYAYEFNERDAPAPEILRTVPFPIGASHSLELRYIFDVGDAAALDPAQQKLSDQMIGYWSHFVSTGVPAVPGAPVWPEINGQAGEGPRMSFQSDGSRVIDTFEQDHQCRFWAGAAQRQGAR